MLRIALALFTTIHSIGQVPPQDEISDAMAHAEALYYGARFSESIALLTRVDETLQTQPARLQERINTKLRLALAYIGMNDTVKAKSFLIQLYALNSDYVLDPEQFSPKVISLAAEAKAEHDRVPRRFPIFQTEMRGTGRNRTRGGRIFLQSRRRDIQARRIRRCIIELRGCGDALFRT